MELNNKGLDSEFILKNSKPYVKGGIERVAHVYFLSYKGVIVYVGMSTNYVQRILSHTKSKAFDSFYTIECTESDMKEVESYYISLLRPFYNVSENEKDQFVPNNTYIKHEDVILLNSGENCSSSRMILDVKGDKIYDAFNSSLIGFIINKVGYIYNGRRYKKSFVLIKCKNGVSEDIEFNINVDILDALKSSPIELRVSFYDLKTAYDFYIYSKLMDYRPYWFTKYCRDNQLVYDCDILLFIDEVFSVSNISMKPKVDINNPHNEAKKDWMALASDTIKRIEKNRNRPR